MADLLSTLNAQQRLAARIVDGPVLIIAGAGTGKTRTIVHRLAHLVTDAGIPCRQLLSITFTTKAAREMRSRITALCRQTGEMASLWIGTIHSLCFEILREHGTVLELPEDFSIIAPAEQAALLGTLAGKFSETAPGRSAKGLVLQISREKSLSESAEPLSPLCRAYQAYLAARNKLDFDDLILKTLALFDRSPEIQKKIQHRFTHISVDEYQDINHAQYLLIRRLCGSRHNVCAVGDADQAIYAFRGARVENFLDFERDFPNARVVFLEKNYRSTATIIHAARQVIQKNSGRLEKTLIPVKPEGDKIHIYACRDEHDEARFIAGEVERLVGGTRFENLGHGRDSSVVSFGDIAILYRLHQQRRPLTKALEQRGIPVNRAASQCLYEEAEIVPVLQALELIHDPHCDGCLARLMTATVPHLGPKTIEQLLFRAQQAGVSLFTALHDPAALARLSQVLRSGIEAWVAMVNALIQQARTAKLDQLIEAVWGALHGAHTEKSDRLLELVTSAQPFLNRPASEAAPDFLNKIRLLTEGDYIAPHGETVSLLTVHAAKGLEFPVVFLTGLETGLFPYRTETPDDAEERRLFYVGMTRAEQRLYLLYAEHRTLFGQNRRWPHSVFLDDVGFQWSCKHVLRATPKRKKKGSNQLKLFSS